MLIYRAENIDNVLTPEECNSIVEQADINGWEAGKIWTTDGPLNSRVDKRYINADRSRVEFDWLTARLDSVFQEANDRIWNFELGGPVTTRVARYQPGGFFKQHIDLGGELGFNRKLTMTIQLSPFDDYDGGYLSLVNVSHTPAMQQGDATMYPTFIPHGVTEVQRGTRYSLIAWVEGSRPFR